MRLKIIFLLLLLILVNIAISVFTPTQEHFDNINLDIGNELSQYFYNLGLSIIQKKDFKNKEDYNEKIFFKYLPTFIKYDFDDIYKYLIYNDVTYEFLEKNNARASWEMSNNKIYHFWKSMKPLIHNILEDAFTKSGLNKNVANPIIHFRCADTPFIRHPIYSFQYYDFFKEAIEKIEKKSNKKYTQIDIMSCSSHNSNNNDVISCKKYTGSLNDYLKGIGYNSEIICNSNIDDFATLFYAPGVISTSSSFSFMAGFFGNGIFISTQHPDGKVCNDCSDFVLYDYNLKHDLVKDYYDTNTVINLLKRNT